VLKAKATSEKKPTGKKKVGKGEGGLRRVEKADKTKRERRGKTLNKIVTTEGIFANQFPFVYR